MNISNVNMKRMSKIPPKTVTNTKAFGIHLYMQKSENFFPF